MVTIMMHVCSLRVHIYTTRHYGMLLILLKAARREETIEEKLLQATTEPRPLMYYQLIV